MTIYTDSRVNVGATNSVSVPYVGVHNTAVVSATLNFATIAAARAAAGLTAVGAGDGVQALFIPAKTLVLNVGLDVTTVEGGTLTIDVGDGADTDGWLDGVNANTVASYASALTVAEGTPNTVVGFSAGKYYSAADTIDLITVNAADAAVMRIWALCVYVG